MPSHHICKRWAFDLANWTPTRAEMARAISVVQPEERERLMRFHFIDDFLTSLVGRLLLRKYVSAETGIPYEAVNFARDERGKPYWVRSKESLSTALPQLSFNVSHQGNFIVLAGVSCGRRTTSHDDFGVGIDVMKLEYTSSKPLKEFFRIMEGKFSAQEWQYIRRPQNSERDHLKAFMRHWCLKEAYVKELGVGLTVDLQKISFTVDPLQELVVESPISTKTRLHCSGRPMLECHFEEHLLQTQYCAAIAFRNCHPEVEPFELLCANDLLGDVSEYLPELETQTIFDYCDKVFKKERKI